MCEVLGKNKKFAKSRDNLNGLRVLPAEPSLGKRSLGVAPATFSLCHATFVTARISKRLADRSDQSSIPSSRVRTHEQSALSFGSCFSRCTYFLPLRQRVFGSMRATNPWSHRISEDMLFSKLVSSRKPESEPLNSISPIEIPRAN